MSQSSAKEVKKLSNFRCKKFLFVASNTVCALSSFAAFSFSLFDLLSIHNGPYAINPFPVILVAIFGSTAMTNLIGCLGATQKSVKALRFFYFLLWTAIVGLVVTLLWFLVPMKECKGDFLIRIYRERVANLVAGAVVIVVMQFVTLLTATEYILVLINEYHEAELCTVDSFCGVSEETLDG